MNQPAATARMMANPTMARAPLGWPAIHCRDEPLTVSMRHGARAMSARLKSGPALPGFGGGVAESGTRGGLSATALLIRATAVPWELPASSFTARAKSYVRREMKKI